MKARGVIVIDYDFPGSLTDIAKEQARLEAAMKELAIGNPRVVFYDCDIKERRGDKRPDLRAMKFRTS
jgi:hypothetical protein